MRAEKEQRKARRLHQLDGTPSASSFPRGLTGLGQRWQDREFDREAATRELRELVDDVPGLADSAVELLGIWLDAGLISAEDRARLRGELGCEPRESVEPVIEQAKTPSVPVERQVPGNDDEAAAGTAVQAAGGEVVELRDTRLDRDRTTPIDRRVPPEPAAGPGSEAGIFDRFMQTTPRQKALAACILIVVAVAIFVAAPDGADSPEPGRQVEASPSPAVATTAEAESVDRGGDREDAVLANPDTSLNAVSTVAVSAPEARVSGEADSPAPRLPANPTADGAGEVPTEAETPVRTPGVAATDVLVLAPGADEPSRLRLESVEDAEAITVELRRTEDIEQPLAVEIMPISREDGLTNAGNLAFTLVEPVVRFAPGRASQRLTIRLPDDELLTGTRRYSFYVAQVSPVPAVLGRIDVAVRDDELIDRAAGLPFGSLSFAYAPDTVSESASDVRIRLLRYGDKRRAFAAKVLIAGVGAIEGEDYVGPSDQIVRFAPGSDTETIFVPLIDDDVAEPEEGLRLALDLPAERRVSPAALYIRIVDDD